MSRWQACHTPATVSEALSLLRQHQDKARIIAGGGDLILDMEAEQASAPEALVDVTRIGGIDRIAREGNAFDRIMRPQGVALPVLGIAARVRLDATLRRIEDVVTAIGPAGPTPFRATRAEEALTTARTFDDAVERAIAAARTQAGLRTSKCRASQEYRREMIGVLRRRVLRTAVERARMNAAPAEPEDA